jgi:hypothetical protein
VAPWFAISFISVFLIGLAFYVLIFYVERKYPPMKLLPMISLRLGLGCFVVMLGLLASVITHQWREVSNALAWFGFICLAMPMLGLGRPQRPRAFSSSTSQNRQAALAFGITMMLIGIPCVAYSIMY